MGGYIYLPIVVEHGIKPGTKICMHCQYRGVRGFLWWRIVLLELIDLIKSISEGKSQYLACYPAEFSGYPSARFPYVPPCYTVYIIYWILGASFTESE